MLCVYVNDDVCVAFRWLHWKNSFHSVNRHSALSLKLSQLS